LVLPVPGRRTPERETVPDNENDPVPFTPPVGAPVSRPAPTTPIPFWQRALQRANPLFWMPIFIPPNFQSTETNPEG
jgi:hypothetical protein